MSDIKQEYLKDKNNEIFSPITSTGSIYHNGKQFSQVYEEDKKNLDCLPLTGGTLTGDLRLKGDGNYGNKLNFGDGDYVHLYEYEDDDLEIKSSDLKFNVSEILIGSNRLFDYTVKNVSVGTNGTVALSLSLDDVIVISVVPIGNSWNGYAIPYPYSNNWYAKCLEYGGANHSGSSNIGIISINVTSFNVMSANNFLS